MIDFLAPSNKKVVSALSMDVLNMIHQAEADAEKIRLDALQKAKDIIRQAGDEGAEILKCSQKEAEDEKNRLIDAAEKGAEVEISKLSSQTDKKCQEIEKAAQEHMGQAVDFIMGRIVNSNGNS